MRSDFLFGMRFGACALTGFLLGMFCGSAWGETFFVRPVTGEYGAENGTSYASAFDGFGGISWATTDTAGAVDAGDTLVVCGAHVGVTLQLTTAQGEGAAGNPITLDFECASNADPATIDTAGAVDYGVHLAAGVDYVTLIRPVVFGVTTTVSGEQALITSRDGTGIVLTNPTTYGNTAGPGIRLRKCQQCTLTAPVSYRNGTHGILLPGDGSRNANNITITSPVVYGNVVAGIRIIGASAATDVQNVTVTDPVAYENGDGMYSILATNVQFVRQSARCIARDNANITGGGEGYGIGIQQTVNSVVRGCSITNNRTDGVEVWGDASVSSTNARIEGNYIAGHTNPIVDESAGNGIECRTGYSTCLISSNILVDNRKNLRLGNSPSGTSEATNNVLSGGLFNIRLVDSNEPGTNAVTGWVVRNNAFSLTASGHHVSTDVAAGNAVTFGVNAYAGSGQYLYNGVTYNEASWSAIESTRLLWSNSQFLGGRNPTTARGFQPRPTSPLCGAGTYLAGTDDFVGQKFEVPPPIGAWRCGNPRATR